MLVYLRDGILYFQNLVVLQRTLVGLYLVNNATYYVLRGGKREVGNATKRAVGA